MQLTRVDIVILAVLVVAAAASYSQLLPPRAFGYDEADYVAAAERGFVANYVDSGAVPVSEFVSKGIKWGLVEPDRVALSKFIRESHDIAFLRHYHAPMSFYGLGLWGGVVGNDELLLRLYSVLVFCLTIVAVYVGLKYILGPSAIWEPTIAATVLMCCYASMRTSAIISTHGTYVLIATITLILIAKLIQTNDWRYANFVYISLGFAFVTSEYAPLLVSTLLLCMLVQRKNLFSGWSRQMLFRQIGKAIAIMVATVFVLWPGGLLKLTFFRNYLFNAYLAVASEGEFGQKGFFELWWSRVLQSPVIYLLLLFAVVTGLLYMRRCRWLMPFLIYGLTMFLLTTKITAGDRYISSMFPPLAIVCGVMVVEYASKLSHRWQPALLSGLLLATLAQGCVIYREIYRGVRKHDSVTPVVRLISSPEFDGKRVLVPRSLGPSLLYYFPNKDIEVFRSRDGAVESLRSDATFDVVISSTAIADEFRGEIEGVRDVQETLAFGDGKDYRYFLLMPGD